jgi:N-acetylmuramoyl-L-alanine amidase
MRHLVVLLILMLSSVCATAQEMSGRQYHKVSPKPGDSQRSLLARYYLDGFDCNFELFRRLNNIRKDDLLQADRDYFLPVGIYTYNDKNIRSSVGISDINTARRIQVYNERLTKEKLRQKTYRDSKILWVPHHEMSGCRTAPTPTTDAQAPGVSKGTLVGTFPIFGTRFSKVVAESNKLKGRVYYIESGHGGPDPGAQTKIDGRTLCEDEYAYDIALRLSRKLIANGAKVYIINRDNNDGIRTGSHLTCDCDEVTYPNLVIPRGQKERLTQRSDAINKLVKVQQAAGVKYQRAVFIHVDSRGKNERIDAFFYYQNGNATSKKMAGNMQKTLKQKYKRQYLGTVTTRDLHMLRKVKTPAVFIEVANIQNSFDRKRLLEERNRQLLAEWLYAGLVLE